MKRALVAGLLALLPVAAPAAEGGGAITIRVTGVRNSVGDMHANVCPQANFLKPGCPYQAVAPAHAGVSVVTVPNVPAGRYAVMVFHDENRNTEVDRGLFGIPREGVGFSRDALKGLSAPKWQNAYFDFDGREGAIELKMRYFLGAGAHKG